jgi:uncharacterized protein YcaQ
MTRKPPTLSTLQARRLLLSGQALLGPPPAGGLLGLIHQLGYVQMDSINVVERAHHLILGSRLPGYEPRQFEALLDGDRPLFEHWTHDASAIPVTFYAHWKVRFPKSRARILANAWWRERVGERVEELLASVLERVREEGPLRSADFEHDRQGSPSAWWGWKPQKAALEFLWHAGELAVARRVHFHKVYDLAERVFPGPWAEPPSTPEAHLDWACATALDRLGVATPRELAAYWNAITPAEATAWCAAALPSGAILKVDLATEGEAPRLAFAVPDWQERLAALPDPGDRMVILCPFDPILRDRARALRLFGFDYRFEAFVPEAKRTFGYYVLPILEGETLVGRLDPKFHRARGVLEIQGLWWEKGIRPTKARLRRLEAALEDLARRIGARTVALPTS